MSDEGEEQNTAFGPGIGENGEPMLGKDGTLVKTVKNVLRSEFEVHGSRYEKGKLVKKTRVCLLIQHNAVKIKTNKKVSFV